MRTAPVLAALVGLLGLAVDARGQCSGSVAVGGVTSGGLVDDCVALLASEAELVGTGTALNWDTGLAMGSWDGLAVTGGRVTTIQLGYLGLNGTIPAELGGLSSLDTLRLDGNELTGTIPAELGDLSSLRTLLLNSNGLTGMIPPELGDLSSLRSLVLSANELTGTIPAELGDLSSLTELSLETNKLTGTIPAKLGDLSSLRSLVLYSNELTGAIPAELGGLSSLRSLQLAANELTGAIPAELGDLSSLTSLWLDANELTGAIPAELGDLSSLESLRLGSNKLTGAIPAELGDLSSLESLWLAANELTGAIPAELGDLSSLESLVLHGNELTGTIPAELGDLSSLEVLFLYGNGLTGTIPAELGDLSSLTKLYLHANELTGTIPAELGNLSSLRELWLGDNGLTGPIPAELGNLSSLGSLFLYRNRLTGCIPMAVQRFASTINPQQGDVYLPRLPVCTGIASTAVTLSVAPDTVAENAGLTNVLVTAALNSDPRAEPTQVTVEVGQAGDTATEGTDFATVADLTVTIPAHRYWGTGEFGLTPTDDAVAEGGEKLTVKGTVTGLTVNNTEVTITDNDPAPTAVTLSLSTSSVSEGASATAITVTASLGSTALPTATTVSVSRTGGTASSGSDYPTISSFSVTIAAEATSGTATLSFDPSEDIVAEGDETVILTGAASGLTSGTATLTISDNDAAPTGITLSLSPSSVSEGASATAITVTASLGSTALTSATTVSVSRTGGTASSGSDYPAISAFSVTIAAEATSGTATLSFDPTEDIVAEGDETVILTGAASGLTSGTATLTISDNDAAPTGITLSLSPSSVSEGASATAITVTASLGSTALTSATTVSVTRTGGTASSGSDYPAISAFSVTIAAEATSGTATLSFDPTEDIVAEGDETVILTGAASGLTSGTATLTISDNDAAPTGITLSLNPSSVSEGASATAITVTASLGSTALPTATTVSVTRTGGTATSGSDYPAISSFSVTIAANATSGTATLSFDPAEDTTAEGDETVILTGAASGLTSGTATLTISDNDTAPTAVTLTLNPNSVGEAAAATTVTVTAGLNGSALPTATTVSVSVTGGTATSGSDYPAISSFSVTIAANATSGTATLSFDPTEDILAEGDETVILTGAASGLTSGTASLTISDNDTAPTAVTLSLSPSSVSEGASATAITVTASLGSSALTTATTVSVSVTGGTATSGSDYPAISSFSVTIAANATSGTATLSFDPTEDILAEGDETVILIGAASGLTSGTASLTISDNDTAPTAVTLSLSPSSVSEGASATAITVTASLGSSALTTATTVSVSVTGGTATSDSDYPAISSFSVTIAANATSGTATLSFDPTEDILAEGDETVILTGAASGLTSGTASLTISDNDAAPTGITLSLNPSSVSEGAAATDITVTASLGSTALPTATTVSVTRTGGTATSGSDYPAISSFSVTIAANATSGTATLSFDPTEDTLAEEDETVILTGAASGLTSGTASLTISDNDTAPTAVTLSLNPNSASEAAAATTVTVTAGLNGSALPTATTVSVSVTGGTATSGSDYPAISSFSVTIAANATSGTATLSFDPTEDILAEGDETVILTGAASGLTSGTASLTISDNDTAPTAVTLSLSPSSVSEGASATAITVTASLGSTALTTATTVSVSVTGGTATSGSDYPAISSFSVTIAANATSGTATLSFDPTEDILAEGDETVILTGAASGLTSGTASLTISDNDTAPTAVTLSLSPSSVSEGASATAITVTASLGSSALPTATTVSVSVTGGTATSGSDYPAISSFSVTIAANATSGTATLSFDPTEDTLAEEDETVILTGAASGLTSGTASLTISDNDTAPTAVTLSLNPNSVGEAAAATTVTVTAGLNGSALPTATTVSVSVTGGTATSGSDYPAISSFSVTIAANATSGTATLSFDPTEDILAEGDETVILTGAASGLTSGTASLTISDNDTAPTAVTLSLSPSSVSEGASATAITVTASLGSSALPTATTVSVSVTGGTATSGSDYPAISSFSVTIAANATSGTATLSFDPTEDILAEGDETVILTGAASGLTSGTASLTISDNDAAPTGITLSLNPSSVSEGAAATDITVTAGLNGSALPTATTVSVSVTGGTATSGSDYPAISSFSVTIAANATSGTATLSFDPTEDTLAEEDETVILTGAASGLTSGTATLTITDNDTAPTAVTLSLNPNSVGEAAAATTVTVTAGLNGSALPTATTVSVSVTGGTATSGSDYPAISSFSVTIAANATSGTATLSFDPTEDILAEEDETVILTGAASGLTPGTATLTISDNDAAPTGITLSLNPSSVSEGAAATDITVTASLGSTALPTATTVSVTRTGGTATSGSDYPAISSFSVTIAANATSGTATLSFDPTEDTLAEEDETVILTGAASGLTSGTASLTISDNDTAPTAVTLSLNPNSVGEAAAATTVTVTAGLNGTALPTATTVSVSVTGGTATSGTDYPAISAFSVTIAANATSGTATLSFDPTEDILAEGDETVILTGAANGLTPGTATLTITDNDTAPTAVTLSLNPNSVGEGDGVTAVTVTANLNGAALSATTVSVSVTGGTATAGTDYTAVAAFTVTIQEGQTSGTAQLLFDPTEDSLSEGEETVIFTGSAAGRTSGTATLTITDVEPAAPTVTLSLNPDSVAENANTTTLTVAAALSGPATSSTEVSVSVTGGTATAGTDYVQLSAFTMTVAAGQAGATAQVSFEPIDDTQAEGEETVVFTATATGLTAGTATLRITDNDQSTSTRDGGPPSVRIWTDQLAYPDDEEISVYLEIDPKGDVREYTVFFYRENIGTGERLYLAPRKRSMELWDGVVDQYGRTEDWWSASRVQRVEAKLIWKGKVPSPGLWHFVAEIRSPGTTQVLQRACAKFVVPREGSRLLNRRGTKRFIETDLRLSNDWVYHLGDELHVSSGATLTIDAGTVIRALGPNAAIIVEQGGRIVVRGRREAPVVMTCSLPVGERRPGCWGGLAVHGTATAGSGLGQDEGAPPIGQIADGLGGAANASDSSGELRYLRVEFAGGGSVTGTPASAVAFEGVGARTVIDHVQTHASAGDGFAFRGGTAHCSYCVSSDTRGNSVAWSMGWRGSMQHLYVQQGAQGASGMHGSAGGETLPGAMPTFYNVTLVGGYNIGVLGGVPGRQDSIGPGIFLESGAGMHARNLLVTGFAGYALDGAAASFVAGSSSVANSILTRTGYRHGGSSQVRGQFKPHVEYLSRDPDLLNVRYEPNPDPRPRSGSVALRLGNAAVPPYDSRFLRSASYVGAFRTKNWLEEWTFLGREQDYEVPVD